MPRGSEKPDASEEYVACIFRVEESPRSSRMRQRISELLQGIITLVLHRLYEFCSEFFVFFVQSAAGGVLSAQRLPLPSRVFIAQCSFD
jgi:hypothetical protein